MTSEDSEEEVQHTSSPRPIQYTISPMGPYNNSTDFLMSLIEKKDIQT